VVQIAGIVPFEIAKVAVSTTPSPPAAANDAYTATATVPLTVAAPGVLANDSDVNGDPLRAVLVSAPLDANASIALNPDGSFTFNYGVNVVAPVILNFNYLANDGLSDSNVASVTVTVNPAITGTTGGSRQSSGGNNGTCFMSVAAEEGAAK
jgi:hypothetical protein